MGLIHQGTNFRERVKSTNQMHNQTQIHRPDQTKFTKREKSTNQMHNQTQIHRPDPTRQKLYRKRKIYKSNAQPDTDSQA